MEVKKLHVTTRALVLREVLYKETDKILTILSEDYGKITVTARGCRKKGSMIIAGCQILTWTQFVLYQQRGQWLVKEAMVEEGFQNLPNDFLRFTLACYLAQVGEALAIEDLPQEDLLSLLLNCIYVLERRQELPLQMVKMVFEIRAICQAGYEPNVDSCVICGKSEIHSAEISLFHGTLHCTGCGRKEITLHKGSLEALRYVITAEGKKIFAFQLEQMTQLANFSEAFLLTQLDRGFHTLDFYKKHL